MFHCVLTSSMMENDRTKNQWNSKQYWIFWSVTFSSSLLLHILFDHKIGDQRKKSIIKLIIRNRISVQNGQLRYDNMSKIIVIMIMIIAIDILHVRRQPYELLCVRVCVFNAQLYDVHACIFQFNWRYARTRVHLEMYMRRICYRSTDIDIKKIAPRYEFKSRKCEWLALNHKNN